MKIDIRSLSEDKLCEFFVKKGFESYRGKQVYEWIWKKSSHTFDNMTNISKDLRLMLNENFVINDNDRVAQMVLTPIVKMELEEINELPNSNRGDGGFGSTGK